MQSTRDLEHVGADDVDGAADDAHDVAVVDGRAVGGGAVADGAGDLAVADLGIGLGHGLDNVVDARIGHDGEQRGECLGDGLGGNDDDALVLACARSGLGGHADVAVVGQDDDGLGVDLGDGLEQVGGGGVHRLAAGNDDVDAKGLQDLRLAGAGSDGDETEGLGGLGSSLLVGMDLGGALGDLEVHVVDEDLVHLAELEHVLEHEVGRVGVHVDLVVGIGADQQLAIAHRGEELKDLVLIEGLLRLEEELVAVTELRALPVVVRLDLDAVEGAGLGGVRASNVAEKSSILASRDPGRRRRSS